MYYTSRHRDYCGTRVYNSSFTEVHMFTQPKTLGGILLFHVVATYGCDAFQDQTLDVEAVKMRREMLNHSNHHCERIEELK